MSADNVWGDRPALPYNGMPTGKDHSGQCPWCSTENRMIFHAGTCPRIKQIVYYPDGTVQRVTLYPGKEPERRK